MVRTQIRLTEEQARQLRATAASAGRSMADLIREGVDRLAAASLELVSSNCVIVETFALLQGRIGLDAVRALQQDVLPAFRMAWIDTNVHRAAVTAALATGKRRLSLVDCSSFELIRRGGLERVLHFDRHFTEQGFEAA